MKIKKDPETPGTYLVESSSSPGKQYRVDPQKPFCTCPAFRFRELKRHGECKHISAVRTHLGEENKDRYKAVLDYVKENSEVDSIELIDKFGEAAVEALIKQGELLESKGMIRILD